MSAEEETRALAYREQERRRTAALARHERRLAAPPVPRVLIDSWARRAPAERIDVVGEDEIAKEARQP